ncbi:hypothetical protein CD006_14830 [Enterobacter sp. 10-1]|nr:hypothetical protein CD006_14830 [Enterobacter sp. 10-1]
MAPLTGIAFACNWLISKLNLNPYPVKTAKMTTNYRWLHRTDLSGHVAFGDHYYIPQQGLNSASRSGKVPREI